MPQLASQAEQHTATTTPVAEPTADATPTAVAATSSAPIKTSAPQASDLASLDTRISSPLFNAAQNVAAAQQCDRTIHVSTVDGGHTQFYTQCYGDHPPLHIDCDGVHCVPQS
ncbi:hypothetical protein [Dyella tabacisoli]|uniref:Uncharacterized protein n=1 Tax=Dyella tabacisoli TaxID=2282381 RepID=A0A369UNW8_9GAMM|nr:hypothetical protein [Dyella tabacisoli]RDD81745.1 hypothetical protein DVJ77_11360 [Dyella tabacisoli]